MKWSTVVIIINSRPFPSSRERTYVFSICSDVSWRCCGSRLRPYSISLNRVVIKRSISASLNSSRSTIRFICSHHHQCWIKNKNMQKICCNWTKNKINSAVYITETASMFWTCSVMILTEHCLSSPKGKQIFGYLTASAVSIITNKIY